jgi:hypothetical protein
VLVRFDGKYQPEISNIKGFLSALTEQHERCPNARERDARSLTLRNAPSSRRREQEHGNGPIGSEATTVRCTTLTAIART